MFVTPKVLRSIPSTKNALLQTVVKVSMLMGGGADLTVPDVLS